MVQSRTGSGKTAAFGIPFANGIVDPEDKFVQALILLPTRELALQVAAELAQHLRPPRRSRSCPSTAARRWGGRSSSCATGGQIVCGTPGRVLDHLRRGTLRLDRVRCAVLDECDEMLSMGFQEDIEAILERTPEERQTLLFSATVPEGIQRLARRFLRNPEILKLSGDYISVHEIHHLYYSIPGVHRENELLRILDFEDPKSAIIFCNTREETGRVAEFLRKQGPRRRGDLVRPVADRPRARDGADARGRHQVPGRDRRRGEVLGDLLAVRVVLVEQVDLLDVRLVLHEGGQRLHLHGGVGVEAEVPVAALAVGQVGVDRGVVEVEHFLAGIALVVLVDGVDDGQRRRPSRCPAAT